MIELSQKNFWFGSCYGSNQSGFDKVY